MPKLAAEDQHLQTVQRLLKARRITGLRARTYGATVIVESGPSEDPHRHIRLTRDSVHLWRLDIADHRGRWEHTPFRANLEELISTVAEMFPWTLQAEP